MQNGCLMSAANANGTGHKTCSNCDWSVCSISETLTDDDLKNMRKQLLMHYAYLNKALLIIFAWF